MKILTFFLLLLFPVGKLEVPELNKKIVEYLDIVIGQQVDKGECWDLAAAALKYSGAYFDRSSQKTIYEFGKVINHKKDKIYPGDIIQMENIKLEYEEDNMVVSESMPHHTAIVYEVLGDGHFKIAHQNTSMFGRKVGISEFKLEYIKKGDLTFYRPYKK